jgi:hypothetical protein
MEISQSNHAVNAASIVDKLLITPSPYAGCMLDMATWSDQIYRGIGRLLTARILLEKKKKKEKKRGFYRCETGCRQDGRRRFSENG